MLSNYRPSNYTIEIEAGESGTLLYNTFSGAFSLLEPEEVRLYERIKSTITNEPKGDDAGILDELLINNFVVPKDYDEIEAVRRKYLKLRNDESGMSLTVVPTLNCNFACDYCFQGRDKSTKVMDATDIERAVSLVKERASGLKTLNITWFGGEPLLGANVIRGISDRIIPWCDNKGITYGAFLVTNGYLLNREQLGRLYVRRVKTIQITLDGAQTEHDRLRYVKHTGAGSFAKIIENVRAYSAEIPVHTTFRVNIDRRNREAIFRLLDDLKAASFETSRVSVYFAPIESSTSSCRGVAASTLERREFAELETELIDYACECGLNSASLPFQMAGLCGATKRKGYVLVPGGDIHKCWETVSFAEKRTGRVEEPGTVVANTNEKRWNDWSPFDFARCTSCTMLPNCVGFCSYKFLYEDEFNDGSGIPCPSIKFNIRKRLLSKAVANKWISDAQRKSLFEKTQEVVP